MTKETEVSVIIVSDWIDPEQRSWGHEREIVKAVAAQDFPHSIETILVEDARSEPDMPIHDLRKLLPGLKIEFADLRHSAELKDWAVARAAGTYVAVLEADCVPRSDWLSRLYRTLRENPGFKAISGRTSYGNHDAMHRVLTLLDRGFNDPGCVGETHHLSNNAALCERLFLADYPYPPHPSPFISARRRILNMQRDGHRFLADPRAVVVHAMEGWSFIRDVRRNTGFGDMVCSDEPRYGAIPRLLLQRLRDEWSDCKRLHRRYLRIRDWPLLLFLLGFLRIMEAPGMLDALRKQAKISRTGYR